MGGIFLLLAFVVFVLAGAGVQLLPRAESFGLACLALGILLLGWPIPPWPPRT
jgi:hypothetical protein